MPVVTCRCRPTSSARMTRGPRVATRPSMRASPGAVAAPTAGLHFAEADTVARWPSRRCNLRRDAACRRRHVSADARREARRPSHAQRMAGGQRGDVCERLQGRAGRGRARRRVGTTSMRALESAARQAGGLAPMRGETDLFLYPGARFRVVDALLDQFPSAAVDPAHAGLRLCRLPYGHGCLPTCGARGLPVLQLRRRHVSDGRSRARALSGAHEVRAAGHRWPGPPRPAAAWRAGSWIRRRSCRSAPTARSRP